MKYFSHGPGRLQRFIIDFKDFFQIFFIRKPFKSADFHGEGMDDPAADGLDDFRSEFADFDCRLGLARKLFHQPQVIVNIYKVGEREEKKVQAMAMNNLRVLQKLAHFNCLRAHFNAHRRFHRFRGGEDMDHRTNAAYPRGNHRRVGKSPPQKYSLYQPRAFIGEHFGFGDLSLQKRALKTSVTLRLSKVI